MIIDILLFPGFQELDAIAPFEVLKNAALCGAKWEVRLVALSGPIEIVGTHGARLWAETKFDLGSRPDVLVVPGGGWIGRAGQGAWAEAERGDIPRAIAQMHEARTVVAAVCTGTMLLAAAGLIKGRPVTTHHGVSADLRATGANVIEARVVDAGDIITSGAITSGLDLALWLVERFAGPAIACKVESMMEYERRGTVWRVEV